MNEESPLYVAAGFLFGVIVGALIWRGLTAQPLIVWRGLVVRKEMDGPRGPVSSS